MQKANREQWKKERDKVISKASAEIQQKAAKAISDNVAKAQRIKGKLLTRLEREIDALPEKIGSESTGTKVEYVTPNDEDGKKRKGRAKIVSSQTYKLRDLTAAYRDLTADMNMTDNTEPVRIIIDV